LYEKALEKDPAHFNSLSNLVTIYAKQNKADQAVSRLDQAINAQQDKAPLHYLKAQALGFQKNAQGAEAELRRALELDPNYLAAYFALGSLYVNTNQEDRAIAEYQKVTEKQSDSDVAYTLIGMLEDSRKNYDASSENYRKALAIKPNNVIAANNLAWNSAEFGKGNLEPHVGFDQLGNLLERLTIGGARILGAVGG
jgi:tetratricopeptide (TPR) repeat protein